MAAMVAACTTAAAAPAAASASAALDVGRTAARRGAALPRSLGPVSIISRSTRARREGRGHRSALRAAGGDGGDEAGERGKNEDSGDWDDALKKLNSDRRLKGTLNSLDALLGTEQEEEEKEAAPREKVSADELERRTEERRQRTGEPVTGGWTGTGPQFRGQKVLSEEEAKKRPRFDLQDEDRQRLFEGKYGLGGNTDDLLDRGSNEKGFLYGGIGVLLLAALLLRLGAPPTEMDYGGLSSGPRQEPTERSQ